MADTITAKSVPHPEYIEYSIYDYPIAGQFYQVRKNDTLTKIAKRAYGDGTIKWWSKINLSVYNSRYTRRKKSTKCKSPLREYPDGFIALCKPYPVLWIPPKEGGEPRPGTTPKKAPSKFPIGPLIPPILKPGGTIKTTPLPATVARAFGPAKTHVQDSAITAAKVAAAATAEVRGSIGASMKKTDKMSDWIGPVVLLIGVGVVGIAFAAKAGAEK